MMGGGDSEDKDAISNALDRAWKEWTKDVACVMGSVMHERTITTTDKQVEGSEDQSDVEDNREDLESDRKVASDDDGDDGDEGSLMVDIGDTKHLNDAGTVRYDWCIKSHSKLLLV